MYIVGLNAYHPDSSACLIKDGQLIAAAEEERFLRIKHWAGLPLNAIRYCLKEAALDIVEVDYIAVNRDPKANMGKKMEFVLTRWPSPRFVTNRLSNIAKIKEFAPLLIEAFGCKSGTLRAKVYYVEHHRAHLASAFFVSPFERAAVVSIDGFGDFVSCTIAHGSGNNLKVLTQVFYPHSLGVLYTAITQFLGFKKFGDEYKVMGLAAYGKPTYLDRLEKMVVLKPRGAFTLDLKYFSFHRGGDRMEWNSVEPKLADLFSKVLVELLGPARTPQEEIVQRHCDIAASLQAMYERVFFHILTYTYEATKSSQLCLAGGCALNSLANGKIFDHTSFKEIYIQPASSDAGGALGAAYYLYNQLLGHERTFIMRSAYWGPEYTGEEISSALEEAEEQIVQVGGIVEKVASEDDLCQRVAQLIACGNVVGWFQGRMEWGPRALGNRSILADPRRSEMKDVLNSRIKRREWFRPFAPSILIENVDEYFEKDYPDPFMIKVYSIKNAKRSIIPAVTHQDGTGRLQTVSREENYLYWKLINEFKKITGVPILLNTSFNENEPIVCKPQEAVECFLRTKMDILVLGNVIIKK